MSVSSPRQQQLDQSAVREVAKREHGATSELIRQLQGRAKADTFKRGTATITWPGGSPISSQVTVNHGLRATPTSVQITAMGFANANAHVQVDAAPDGTSFRVRGRTIDGSSPAAATTCTFMWEVRV